MYNTWVLLLNYFENCCIKWIWSFYLPAFCYGFIGSTLLISTSIWYGYDIYLFFGFVVLCCPMIRFFLMVNGLVHNFIYHCPHMSVPPGDIGVHCVLYININININSVNLCESLLYFTLP